MSRWCCRRKTFFAGIATRGSSGKHRTCRDLRHRLIRNAHRPARSLRDPDRESIVVVTTEPARHQTQSDRRRDTPDDPRERRLERRQAQGTGPVQPSPTVRIFCRDRSRAPSIRSRKVRFLTSKLALGEHRRALVQRRAQLVEMKRVRADPAETPPTRTRYARRAERAPVSSSRSAPATFADFDHPQERRKATDFVADAPRRQAVLAYARDLADDDAEWLLRALRQAVERYRLASRPGQRKAHVVQQRRDVVQTIRYTERPAYASRARLLFEAMQIPTCTSSRAPVSPSMVRTVRTVPMGRQVGTDPC